MKDKEPRIRDYFVAGLTALLPLWLTLYILWFLIKLVGNLLFPVVRPILRSVLHYQPPEGLLVAFSAALVVFLVWGMGYLVLHVIGHGHVARVDAFVARVPVARTIHSVIRRLLEVIFSTRGTFERVVRVEFPVAGQYAVGFVTSDDVVDPSSGDTLCSVMVPTAPNPTSGFLLFVPRSKLVLLKMSVDEAMTLIVSMGTFGPRSLPPAR